MLERLIAWLGLVDISRHLREHISFYLPLALIVAAVLAVAGHYARPLPPRHLVMAGGTPGGVYHAMAQRYRERLAREGIAVEIVSTLGAVANLALLRETPRRVDVALIQGGVGAAGEDEGLEALGSIFYEPVFVFARRSFGIKRLGDLKGRRLAIGPEGSGTRLLARQLLAENGFDLTSPLLLPQTGAEARAALMNGDIDAAVFVIAQPLPSLEDLFRHAEIELIGFDRLDAYRMVFPFLAAVTLPAGAISLANDIPARDIPLIAPVAALVVHEDVHPALKNLLVRINKDLHGSQQLFAPAGRFPAADHLDYPLNAYARRFIESGPSLFARFLPFWVAVWGERLLILLVPLLGMLVPLLRLGPPLFRWRTERKIYRWYRHLGRLEREARETMDPAAHAKISEQLDELHAHVRAVRVPLSYAKQHYDLREHIDFVRSLLR